MAWFRVYDTLIDNPKVMRLKADAFRALIAMWCLAKRCGGILPDIAEIAFSLRAPVAKVDGWVKTLEINGLLDRNSEGTLRPHDWDEHQYVSDDVTSRVRKHREKHTATVTGNADETTLKHPGNTQTSGPEQNRAESEQSRTDSKGAPSGASRETPEELLDIPDKLDRRRGTRLPDDWTLPDEWREWARTNTPTLKDIDWIADDFADHWHGKTGKDATKADWAATWRRWCRKAVEIQQQGKGNGTGRQRQGNLQSSLNALAGVARGAGLDPRPAAAALPGPADDGGPSAPVLGGLRDRPPPD